MRTPVRVASICLLSLCSAGALWAADAPRGGGSGGSRTTPTSASALGPNSALSQLEKADPNEDMSAPADYNEVVHALIEQLLDRGPPVPKAREVIRTRKKKEEVEKDTVSDKERYTISAQDAARKLASLGSKAVPDLTLLFKVNYAVSPKSPDAEKAKQVTYYSAWALARIRTAEAARALLPLMLDPAAPHDLRLMAVNAAGWEKSESGMQVLQKVATADPDIEIRKLAFGQLAMTPEYWIKNEAFFVKALNDSNDDIRTQAAKACHFAHVFLTASPKLIELLEKDPVPGVKLYAMLALARMKVLKAQPVLIRMIQQADLDEKMRKQALNSLIAITDIGFRNYDSALAWWEKEGKTAYELYEMNDKRTQEALAGEVKPLVVRPAAANAPLTGKAPAPEARDSVQGVDAEIIPLEPLPPKAAAEPAKTEPEEPAANATSEPRKMKRDEPPAKPADPIKPAPSVESPAAPRKMNR